MVWLRKRFTMCVKPSDTDEFAKFNRTGAEPRLAVEQQQQISDSQPRYERLWQHRSTMLRRTGSISGNRDLEATGQ
jgi:hypothetical protein